MKKETELSTFNPTRYKMAAEDCLEYRRNDNMSAIIIDLREKEEFDRDHLAGAYSLPAEFLQDYVDQMPTHVKIVLYAGSNDNVSIDALKMLIENEIKDVRFVAGGFPTLLDSLKSSDKEVFLTDFPPDEWEKQIKAVLEEKIIPRLEADGGGLVVNKVIDDKVFIQYSGACNGCPSAASGELNHIKNTLGIALNHMIDVEVV